MQGKNYYHLKSTTGHPKSGLLDYMAIISYATSPYLCFLLAFARFIALDPLSSDYLFRKCDRSKYKKLSNKLKKSIEHNIDKDSSEIVEEPTPHYLPNCYHNDLHVANVPKQSIDYCLGHTNKDNKEESLTHGDSYIRTLPFEPGDYLCAKVLSSYKGHGMCPMLIDFKVFGNKFKDSMKKVIKKLFRACYEDLGLDVCDMLFTNILR